jgi:hypothetical protein
VPSDDPISDADHVVRSLTLPLVAMYRIFHQPPSEAE